MKKKNLPKTHFELIEECIIQQGYTFKEWLHIKVTKFKSIKNPSYDIIKQMQIVSMYKLFELNGKKSFYLTEDLCYLLYNTDLKNVDSSMLHLPFETFYIGGLDCLNFIENINGVYIAKHINPDHTNKGATYMYDLFLYYIDTHNIQDTINAQYEIHKGDILEQIMKIESNFNDRLNIRTQCFNIARFIINCILYLTSENSIIEKIIPVDFTTNKKNKAKIKKARKHSGTQITQYKIGPTRIDRKLKQALVNHTHNPSKNNRHTNSWVVMGHWHPYWVLKENVRQWEWDEKKVIKASDDGTKHLVKKWVKPYLKGDGEPPNEKTYIVK